MSWTRAGLLLAALSTFATPVRAQEAGTPWFSRVLTGAVGDRPATLDLRREDDRVSANVASDDGELFLWVSGTVDDDGRVRLETYDEDQDPTAVLTGRLVRQPGDAMVVRGTYQANGDSLPFAFDDRGVPIGGWGRLVSRTLTRGDSASGWVVRAEIPTARSTDEASAVDAARLHALGRVADSLVRADLEGFVSTLELDDPYAYGPPFPSTREIAWTARHAGERLVSLEFDVYVYYTGAAHPNSETFTLNWDLVERRTIELAELFRDDAGWVEVVSRHAIERLVDHLGDWAEDDGWVAEGAGPNPTNFAAWTIDPEGLRIVFDPYQVAAYAAGPQTVTIPWEALADVLDPDAPWTAAGGT